MSTSCSVSASESVTYLDRIVAWHRDRAANDARDTSRLLEEARVAALNRRPDRFVSALVAGTTLNVIAEIKRRSPSRGDIAPQLSPREIADDYRRGGAAALSVLTDEPHFGGSVADLVEARTTTDLPILRKDFTVDSRDVLDACIMGADAVLLIVAALSDEELSRFIDLATELRLGALIEVHDEGELRRGLAAGARMVGVNQRNLKTFEVDTSLAARMGTLIPAKIVAIAESGITGVDDAQRCAAAGYRAVLVGEHLVRSTERQAALRELRVALPS